MACGPKAADSPPPAVVPSRGSEGAAEAHDLVVAAASCWFGGTWADALGEEGPPKEGAIESRCRDVERRVWEGAEDATHYEQLRALEANAVAAVTAQVEFLARREAMPAARREALVTLTAALADAQREGMMARRAAERVKRDLDREPEKLSTDEVSAVAPLREQRKVDALLSLPASDLSAEANALGLLSALDRVQIARGLPKHLKVYAVAGAFHSLFGVDVPKVPEDATQKLVPGTWLSFLSDTAKAAGYPVGADAKTPRQRDSLAWAGMLEGFADKLRADQNGISAESPLSRVVAMTVHRLHAEYEAQRAAALTLRSSAAR